MALRGALINSQNETQRNGTEEPFLWSGLHRVSGSNWLSRNCDSDWLCICRHLLKSSLHLADRGSILWIWVGALRVENFEQIQVLVLVVQVWKLFSSLTRA